MRKYYKDLPTIIQEMALANCKGIDKEHFKEGILHLSAAFSWDKTPEGHDFWSNVYSGGKISEEFLFSEEDLFNKVFRLISKVIKHGK